MVSINGDALSKSHFKKEEARETQSAAWGGGEVKLCDIPTNV